MDNIKNTNVSANFKEEKNVLLGELAGRMKHSNPDEYKNRRDDDHFDDSFPPPPPVFQTYAAQLSGKDEDDLPPPPPPLQSGQCYSCSGEVLSGGCTAVGRTYHQDCFKCSNCHE